MWQRSKRLKTLGAPILTGLVGAGFWLTREEGIWIAPAIGVILLLAGTTALLGGRRTRRSLPDLLLRWGIAAVAFTLVTLSVAATNEARYGAFETTEVQSLPFRRAYGALAGIQQDQWRRFVVFPKDAREKAYAVSPAARELAPALEGPSGESWRQSGCSESGQVDCPEILAGWFQWALRDAVAAAGHYATAGDAARYYDTLADQIEAACQRGALSCLPPRATLVPPFRWAYLADAARTLPEMIGILFNVAFVSDPNSPLPTSEGSPDDLTAFSRIVGPVWPAAAVSDDIEGWITSVDGLPALAVDRGPESRARVAVDVQPAPDVAAAFPNRRSERFSIMIAGPDQGDTLQVSAAAGSESFPLMALTAGTQIERGDYAMHIDVGIEGPPSSPVVPRWRRVVMALAKGISRIYVWLLPPAFAVAVLGYALAWSRRRHESPPLTVVALALASATAVCSRLTLVSYLDVTAIPSANNLYPSPASPFLLLFVGTGCYLGMRVALRRWTARESLGRTRPD